MTSQVTLHILSEYKFYKTITPQLCEAVKNMQFFYPNLFYLTNEIMTSSDYLAYARSLNAKLFFMNQFHMENRMGFFSSNNMLDPRNMLYDFFMSSKDCFDNEATTSVQIKTKLIDSKIPSLSEIQKLLIRYEIRDDLNNVLALDQSNTPNVLNGTKELLINNEELLNLYNNNKLVLIDTDFVNIKTINSLEKSTYIKPFSR